MGKEKAKRVYLCNLRIYKIMKPPVMLVAIKANSEIPPEAHLTVYWLMGQVVSLAQLNARYIRGVDPKGGMTADYDVDWARSVFLGALSARRIGLWKNERRNLYWKLILPDYVINQESTKYQEWICSRVEQILAIAPNLSDNTLQELFNLGLPHFTPEQIKVLKFDEIFQQVIAPVLIEIYREQWLAGLKDLIGKRIQ